MYLVRPGAPMAMLLPQRMPGALKAEFGNHTCHPKLSFYTHGSGGPMQSDRRPSKARGRAVAHISSAHPRPRRCTFAAPNPSAARTESCVGWWVAQPQGPQLHRWLWLCSVPPLGEGNWAGRRQLPLLNSADGALRRRAVPGGLG